MKDSTKLLHADLLAAGLHELAFKAAQDFYHDYVSPLETPELVLLAEVTAAINEGKGDRAKALAVIRGIMDGKYDATKAESDEWAASPDGQEALAALTKSGLSLKDAKDLFGLTPTPATKGKPH